MPTYCGSQGWHNRTDWDIFGEAQRVRKKVAARCGCEKCNSNLRRWVNKDYTLDERVAQLEAVVQLVQVLSVLNMIAFAIWTAIVIFGAGA